MGLLVSNPQTTQPPAVSMQQQLAQEEITMRAQVAQQQQQMPYQLNTAQLLDATRRLGSYGFGMPSLGGNAAQAYALAGGQSVPAGFVYNGIAAPPGAKRSLHTVLLNEVAHIFQLESELADERASQAAPHAPAVQEPSVKVQSQPIVAGILPPDAPESIPQLAQVYDSPAPPQPETTFANVIVTQPTLAQEAATEPKKRGRPPKKIQDTTPEPVALAPHQATQIAAMSTPPPDALATPVAPAVVSAYPVGTVENPTPQIHHEMNELFVILVNARCDGLATKSLAAYVDYINETVAKKYNTTRDGRQGPLDVRAAVEGSGLGYGGWKGFVREIVKVDPPPAGLYHFDTYMSELNEIVADALRVVAEAKGWLFVRGVRT